MQLHQFENLRERLLRAGVAPRHVHRYIYELRDHYDDALRAELATGINRAAAEQAAGGRLGDEESLTNSVLARPELRSMIARFPRLIFGIAPFLTWIAFFALSFLALFVASGHFPDPEPARVTPSAYVLCFFDVYILPVILGMAAFMVCARQRLTPRWPIVGVAAVVLVSGTLDINVAFPATLAEQGQLGIRSSLAPFFFPYSAALGKPDIAALVAGLARGVLMLAISLTPYLVWHRHQWRMDCVSHDTIPLVSPPCLIPAGIRKRTRGR